MGVKCPKLPNNSWDRNLLTPSPPLKSCATVLLIEDGESVEPLSRTYTCKNCFRSIFFGGKVSRVESWRSG